MAKVSLAKVLDILEAIDTGNSLSDYEVTLCPDVIERARAPIERMLQMSA